MGILMESVEKYFMSEGWEASRVGSDAALRVGVSTKNARWQCVANVDEEDGVVFFHSICPLKAAADARGRIAEFLMRLNRVIFLGHFVMDFDSGEIRFETYLIAREGYVNREAMGACVDANIAAMDKHIGDIARVISTGIPPAEAVAQALTGVPVDGAYRYN